MLHLVHILEVNVFHGRQKHPNGSISYIWRSDSAPMPQVIWREWKMLLRNFAESILFLLWTYLECISINLRLYKQNSIELNILNLSKMNIRDYKKIIYYDFTIHIHLHTNWFSIQKNALVKNILMFERNIKGRKEWRKYKAAFISL